MNQNKVYTHVSLFSGAGGLDIGLEQAGFHTVWANDFNHDACETHRLWSNATVVEGDIGKVDYDIIPDCDIASFGFPCQGFSLSGPRKIDDSRNVLYRHCVKLVEKKQPKLFLAENVKGLLTLGGGKIKDAIIADFESKGYVVSINLVNAADYHVPEDRQRILLVGIRKDLAEKYGVEFKVPAPFPDRISIRQALEGLAPAAEDEICKEAYSSRYMSRNRKRVSVGHFDVLIIDEYQDINEEISKMLEYIKESNPGLQIIAVGDMKQKIYDQTSLDIWSFIHKFLGKHTQVNFTQCFRLSHDLAQRLGNIWGKDINGVNKNCKVSTMSREQVVDYLDTKNPKDVLCLGARTGSMVKVLNELEARPGNLYDKNHVYASIKEPDGEKHVAPGADVGIFTTFDGSKGMERPICVVFDFTESYWCSRVFQPTARYEILRNLFCVAASRGKDEVIFVEPPKKEDRFGLVSDKTLMTPVKMNQEFNTKFDISEMFDFKFDEDVEHCYQLINTTPVFHKDVHEIEIKHSDAMIDLAPCIGIYQQANFFDYYDIDSAIAFYMYLHNDKKVALPASWKSVEEKVLFLTMLMTSQDRYVKQVELPFITRAQETDLNKRLSMVFTPDESVQERCELTAMVDTKAKKKLVISGMADVVKDNKVYLLKFVSSLAHKHFLQCACYMLATGLKQGVVWNIRDNMMYEIEIPDPDKFLDAVITCITKQVFAKAESYTISKDYTQDLDTIIEQIMTDDSLPEFDVGGNVKEEKKTADEGISIIRRGEQYIIVDAANRQIIDNSAMNGYDSILAACEDYVRKNKQLAEESMSKKELLSVIEDWLDNHRDFEAAMSKTEVDIKHHIGEYANYASLSTYVVRKMLKDRGLIINFSERQLLKVWKERKKKDTNTVENTRYETLASTLESLVKAGVDVQLEMPEEEKVAKPEPDPEEEKPQFDKRIPYTVIRSSRLSKPNDVRYIVVNLNDKDQVLDDASGYGYKSISAAQKGYGYKCRNLTKYGEVKHSSKPKTNIPVSQSRQLSFGDF